MRFPFRAVTFLFLVLAVLIAVGPASNGVSAQEKSAQGRIVRDIETRGFRNVTGLRRRGGNYVFQAEDLFGHKVRVVMNAESGEIVGLSRTAPNRNKK